MTKDTRLLLKIVASVALGLPLGCGNLATSERTMLRDTAKLSSPEALPQAPTPLLTPTYDGSGQATEPTVIYFPNGWQGHLYWMVLSPFPNSNARFENPSVLVSEDGQRWSVPFGLTNPLWLPSEGHLSDATLLYDDDSNQLFIYFLNEIPGPEPRYFLLRTTSSDGIHWSLPEIQISGENTYLVSPTVAKVADTFYLWTVDTDSGCNAQNSTLNRRSSPDGATWSAPQPNSISQPGFVIWHINVISVPSEGQFMSLMAGYPVGSDCGHTKLFFANTNDGVNWKTYSQPVLDIGSGWQSQEIYRSSLLYNPSTTLLRTWYSALDSVTRQWHIGYTEKRFNVD